MNPEDLVLITWIDAATEGHGWRPLDRIKSQMPPTVLSVGWIVKETSEYVTIISSYMDNDNVDGDTVIPVGMIIKRQRLNLL